MQKQSRREKEREREREREKERKRKGFKTTGERSEYSRVWNALNSIRTFDT